MPYWKYASLHNSSPSFAGYAYGTAKDFTLTFVNDSGAILRGAYIFVDNNFFDWLQVKLPNETDNDYRPVCGRLDALGYIGDVPEGAFDINFRLVNQTTDATMRMFKIQVWLGHADGTTSESSFWFWHYLDLDDYLYFGDESGLWDGPGGPSALNNRIGWESDWWLWADCEENQNLWNDESPINRKACSVQFANIDSYDTTGMTNPFCVDGSVSQWN